MSYYLEYYKIAYRTLFQGQYFGTYEVSFNMPRTKTIQTIAKSSMLFLSKQMYKKLIENDHREISVNMRKTAKRELKITEHALKRALELVNKKMFYVEMKGKFGKRRLGLDLTSR